MHAVGCSRPTWRLKEENRRRRKWGDRWDRWMRRMVTPRGRRFSTSCYCRFSKRALKDNPIFSLMASTPLLILCLAQKNISIFLTQHGILFPDPATLWQRSYRDPSSDGTTTEQEEGGGAGKPGKKSIPSKCLRKKINKCKGAVAESQQ